MPRLIKNARRIIGGTRKKIINATANVISAPAQIKSKMVQRQANKDVSTIRLARAYDKSTSDKATMARTASYVVKKRLSKKK